jgi:hypothetical protein
MAGKADGCVVARARRWRRAWRGWRRLRGRRWRTLRGTNRHARKRRRRRQGRRRGWRRWVRRGRWWRHGWRRREHPHAIVEPPIQWPAEGREPELQSNDGDAAGGEDVHKLGRSPAASNALNLVVREGGECHHPWCHQPSRTGTVRTRVGHGMVVVWMAANGSTPTNAMRAALCWEDTQRVGTSSRRGCGESQADVQPTRLRRSASPSIPMVHLHKTISGKCHK